MNLVDDYSGYTKVYLMRSKIEVERMLLKYKVEVKISFGRENGLGMRGG